MCRIGTVHTATIVLDTHHLKVHSIQQIVEYPSVSRIIILAVTAASIISARRKEEAAGR